MAEQAHKKSTDELIVNYLNVANAAMASHKDEFPYRQLQMVGDKFLNDKTFGVGIFKNDPTKPHDYFTVRYKDGSFRLEAHGKKNPDINWRCKQDYLEKVVSDPEKYIASPAKLDWDWLKSFLQ